MHTSDITTEMSARGIATVTFGHVTRANSLTSRFFHELISVLETLAADDSVRALRLNARGRHFCVGGDRATLHTLPDMSRAELNGEGRLGARAVTTLLRFPTPTVAAVHGAAFGGGVSLALACDAVIVADDARLGLVFTRMGLPACDMACQWLLARRCGRHAAYMAFLAGAVLSADEALAGRVVDEVVPVANLDEVSLRYADHWSSLPPLAVRATKRSALEQQGAFNELDGYLRADVERMTDAFLGQEFLVNGFDSSTTPSR